MQVDALATAPANVDEDWQGWIAEASLEQLLEYKAQPEQAFTKEEPAYWLEQRGKKGGGKGKGGRGKGTWQPAMPSGGATTGQATRPSWGANTPEPTTGQRDTRICHWCKKAGHVIADCKSKLAGKPRASGRPAGSLEHEQDNHDYKEVLTGKDRPCDGLSRSCDSLEVEELLPRAPSSPTLEVLTAHLGEDDWILDEDDWVEDDLCQ